MILSPIAYLELRNLVIGNQDFIGKTKKVSFIASDDIDQYFKGKIDMSIPEDDRKITDIQEKFLDDLQSKGQINKVFNKTLFTKSDSREAELSGVLGAVIGSFYSLLIAGLLSIPIGIGAAIYLQEFAKKNRITDFIEININNLAAVPSIVFGLLGLAIFLNMFLMPRSAPLVGGMVLALMTLPKIIIPARAAILAVPNSIKDGALALGASHMQAILHYVLPLAMPAILTGIIIGLAQALGETAPLLMIGMVAFSLVGLLLQFPTISVAVRRLHDIGRSGWWYLICMVPIIGNVFLIVYWASPGDKGSNRYGPNPNQRTQNPQQTPDRETSVAQEPTPEHRIPPEIDSVYSGPSLPKRPALFAFAWLVWFLVVVTLILVLVLVR